MFMIIESYLYLACFLYSKYAEILAAQGCLETAMGYLMTVNDQVRAGVCCRSMTQINLETHWVFYSKVDYVCLNASPGSFIGRAYYIVTVAQGKIE